AARNFERVQEWQKAINTYQVLVEEYPDSKYALPALGNIAEDYKVMEDYANAAYWNEQIFHRFPGTKEAEDALYNASYFYEKAEQWPEVIRVNNLFIATYPDNPESKNLFFDNAKYYLKLGNLARANQIYQEFANLYPDDPRTVEAFYQRGKYYFAHDKLDSAEVEFNRAIQKSNELAAKGMDPNLYYASEAYYQLGEILFKKFQAVELTYPPEVLRARLNEKSRLLKQVVDAFTKVVEFGSIRSFPAMYRIAQAYEEMADAIAFQKLPPNLTPEQRLVEQDRVFKASVPAYDRAVEEYKNVLKNLPVLAEKLGVSLSDTARLAQPKPAPATDTTVAVKKVVEEDSTLQVAVKWYNKTRERISSILFTVAERSEDFITAYLRSPNPFPQGDIRNLAYRARVLRELVAPSVQTTLNAHLKNVMVSRELGLKNRYVTESSRKLILVSNILADQYGDLFWSAKDIYQQTIPVLEDLIERGETATTPDNMNYYDVQDNLIMVAIRFMDEFAGTAEQQYKNTLDLAAQYDIQNDARLTTEEKLFNFAFEAGKTMLDLKTAAEEKREAYADKYAQTDNPSYDLASVFFDDQAVELGNNAENVLANAYDIAKANEIDNLWTKQILSLLIELQPDKYVPELPMEKVALASDTTWRATTVYEPGWNQLSYSDTAWSNAVAVNLPLDMSFPVYDSLGVNPTAIWVRELLPSTVHEGMERGGLELKEIGGDSLAETSDSTAAISGTDTAAVDTASQPVVAFFRKRWFLRSSPINAELAITADQSFRLFINEQYIVGLDQVQYQEVTRVPFEAIREILKSGDNIIACRVEDSEEPHYGLRFYLEVALKPSQLEDIKQQIARSMQINVDPGKLDRMVTLNRNRIVH
ncbi:MAG: tetratricopeptide repeat protein, partial [Calditrichaeota bacterium]